MISGDIMRTTKMRSVAKAFTWMTLATFTGFCLIYFLTQDITIGLMFASINFILKLILYYIHERGWDVVKWGKVPSIKEI